MKDPLNSSRQDLSERIDWLSGEQQLNEVRRYQSRDAGALLDVYNDLESGGALSAYQLSRRLDNHENAGGKTWILAVDGHIKGYATLIPVPALDGWFDLGGGIAPANRRRGLGSHLLDHIIREGRRGGVQQITCAVDSLGSAVALFLQRNGFQVEHEEWRMDKVDLSELIPVFAPEGYRLQYYRRTAAIKWFRELYEASFANLAWYQPYQTDAEVSAEMEDDDCIVFLLKGKMPVGFIWLRWPEPKVAEIEPLGIVASHQGRGLGRFLVESGLSIAAEQGTEKVEIGVWSDNLPAVHLYQDLGFRHTGTLTYLAYTVSSR
jgi:mycothiol synthase